MSRRPCWPTLFGTVVFATAAQACGSGSTTTPPPGGGSIALALTPTGATIPQGDSTIVTGTLSRTNFTGDVAINVEGAPAGVTGTVTLAPTNGGTSAQVAIAVSSAAAVGSYPLTVRAKGNGVADATATFALTIAVSTVAVASVAVTPAAPILLVGQTVTLTATPKNANGDALTGRVVTWSTSDNTIATVSAAGLVSGVAPGSVTITATSEGKSGTATVVVRVPVATVTVTPAAPVLLVGQTVALTATPKDANGNALVGRTVTWSSSDTTIALSSASGVVLGGFLGVATVTATSEGQAGGTAVTVDPITTGPIGFVAAGQGATCGLAAAGVAYCWGSGNLGQLGNGTTISTSSPTRVSTTVSFASVSLGRYHSCGLATTGAGYCWGRNTDGELGDGTNITSLTPVPVSGGLTFSSIGVGIDSYVLTCGLTTGGTAYCWGENNFGELGTGNLTASSTPIAVAGGHTFTALAVSDVSACGLVAGGAAFCWGDNTYGELGNGTTNAALTPTAVSGGLLFTSISTVGGSTCGLTAAGAAYCWGANNRGQLGDGTTTARLAPTAVAGGVTFRVLAAGIPACGLTIGGSAYCWGDNGAGSFGNGTTAPSLVPVAAGGGLVFASIGVGYEYACGVTTSGITYCWGANGGELGDGTTNYHSLPVKVIGQP